MEIGHAYRAFGIDIVYCPEFLGRFNDSSSLNGDAIPESLALTVDDARDEEVASHAVGLGCLDDGIVRVDCLMTH